MSAEATAAAAMEEEEVAVVPSGYRFLPTDLELVRDYLRKKITNQKLPSDVPVVEYDIYATEPWNLPVNNKIDTINNKRSYYFVRSLDGIGRLRQRKVNPSNSVDVDDNGGGDQRRGGGGGFWKTIVGGRDTRYIRDESYRSIGVKKSFAFHAYLSSPPRPDHTNNNNTTSATTGSAVAAAAHDDNDATTTTPTTTTAMATWKTNWIMDEYSLNTQRNQPWVLCILRKKALGGGGEEGEGDEVQLLSSLQQQLQEKVVQLPNHDYPQKELEILEEIKTIQDRIRANQIQIWDDQYELRRLNRRRILFRRNKLIDNCAARFERYMEKWSEYIEAKGTYQDFSDYGTQAIQENKRERAALDAEAAVIQAGSYYLVELPSRFKKRKRRRS